MTAPDQDLVEMALRLLREKRDDAISAPLTTRKAINILAAANMLKRPGDNSAKIAAAAIKFVHAERAMATYSGDLYDDLRELVQGPTEPPL